jgi:hypothetical protein
MLSLFLVSKGKDMQMRSKRILGSWALLIVIAAFVALHVTLSTIVAAEAASDPAIERARRTVLMLDDVYKTAIVLITDKYVHDEGDFPAGSAAVAWFEAINSKGWHEVRLLDATGMPHDDKNTARDAFDRHAIEQLKAGKPFVEQVEDKDGKRVLRAATPVPVVMKKCVMCHDHYADAKAGEPIGILSYSMPVD